MSEGRRDGTKGGVREGVGRQGGFVSFCHFSPSGRGNKLSFSRIKATEAAESLGDLVHTNCPSNAISLQLSLFRTLQYETCFPAVICFNCRE